MLAVTHDARLQLIAALRAAGCVFAEDESDLLIDAATTQEQLEEMTTSRIAGLPLEQIIGWAKFCGLRIVVEPGVFVPRRRTEFLARQAAMLARRDAVVVDMGCGSGTIGAALLSLTPGIELHAVDIDAAAVHCARRNLAARGLAHHGDLFDALPGTLRGRIDIVVANAPYVPRAEIATMPTEARDYEPAVALDGGPDGTDIQRRIVEASRDWLAPGGRLLIETSARQAATTLNAFVDNGFAARVKTDDALESTIVIGISLGHDEWGKATS